MRLRVEDVAQLLGVHKQTIYRWEWGRIEPELADLCALADLYSTSVGWLVRAEGGAPAYVIEALMSDEGAACQTG